jgi:hypothetical protein
MEYVNEFSRTVKDALEYYDINNAKYYDIINKFKYCQINNDEGKIIFYDKNKEKSYNFLYDVIGKYLPNEHIWVWGWSDGNLNKQNISTSRKVLNYALDLNRTELSLKTELITSRIQITSQHQIDIHVALSAFLSKQPFIFKLNSYGSYEKIIKLNQHKPVERIYYLGLLDI